MYGKPLRFMFGRVDEFIRDYDRTKYSVLFCPKKYAIFDRITYLIGLKSDISYVASGNYAKIQIDSDDDLPLEKTLSLCNVVIPIK